jgi:exopolyphosphatase/pppGpp-phosphohydrolase
MNFLLGKLKEKSTYAGIAALLAAYGWSVDPDQFAAASAAIIAIVGLWEVLRREAK